MLPFTLQYLALLSGATGFRRDSPNSPGDFAKCIFPFRTPHAACRAPHAEGVLSTTAAA